MNTSCLSVLPEAAAAIATAQHSPLKAGRWVRAVLFIAVFAIPFGSFYLPGTGNRIGVVRLSELLMIAAIAAQPRLCLGRFPGALLAFFFYTLWRLVQGFILTPEAAGTWGPSTRLLWDSLFFLLFLVNVLRAPGMPRLALWAVVWGGMVLGACHAAGFGVSVVPGEEDRVSLFGENANVVGCYYGVALLCFLCLWSARGRRLGIGRFVLGIAGVLLAYGLALTGSRGGFLVLAVGFMVMTFGLRRHGSLMRHYGLALMAALVLAGVFASRPTVLNRLRGLATPPNTEARARMFPVLWQMFLRHPTFGAGPDSYEYELTRRAMPAWLHRNRLITAHNLVLLILVETGVVGLVIYGAGYGAVFRRAWHTWRDTGWVFPLALVAGISLLIVLAGVIHYGRIYWFVLAFAYAPPFDD